jgi:hypothetical protein
MNNKKLNYINKNTLDPEEKFIMIPLELVIAVTKSENNKVQKPNSYLLFIVAENIVTKK